MTRHKRPSKDQLILQLQEANRELYSRYRALQDELIEAHELDSWEVVDRVDRIVQDLQKRQSIEHLRFSNHVNYLPENVRIDDNGIH